MWFVLISLAVWLLYVFLLYYFRKERFFFPAALLPLLLFSMLVTVDLGVNYLAAAAPVLNDGIGLHGFFAPLFFGNSGWGLALFRQYYAAAFCVSCFLLVGYMLALVVSAARKKKSKKV